MGTIVVKCPKTGKTVSTGMGASKAAFESSQFVDNSFKCPVCGDTHTWSKKDAWLEGED